MIQICMTPGPESPKDIWSFLRPVLEELEILQDKGMTIKVGDLTFQVKVHVRFTTGDIPALAKLCGHSGHTATYMVPNTGQSRMI